MYNNITPADKTRTNVAPVSITKYYTRPNPWYVGTEYEQHMTKNGIDEISLGKKAAAAEKARHDLYKNIGQTAYDGVALVAPEPIGDVMDGFEWMYNTYQLADDFIADGTLTNNPDKSIGQKTLDVTNWVENTAGQVPIKSLNKIGDAAEFVQDIGEIGYSINQVSKTKSDLEYSEKEAEKLEKMWEWYKLTTTPYQRYVNRMNGNDPIINYFKEKEYRYQQEQDAKRHGEITQGYSLP